jgi:hypothetical protein
MFPHGGAAAVEIEPQGALQMQTGSRRIGVAAIVFGQRQGRIRGDQMGGQSAEIRRQVEARGIDGRRAAEPDAAQIRIGAKRPDLLRRPLRVQGFGGKALRRRGVAAVQQQPPLAGPHLHAQAAIGFDAGGQGRFQRDGLGLRRQ